MLESSSLVTGAVNLWGDPDFVNPGQGDSPIDPGSAAVEMGMDTRMTAFMDGQPRPVGSAPDLGADEREFALYYLPLVAR